jgi:hypothetical protein
MNSEVGCEVDDANARRKRGSTRENSASSGPDKGLILARVNLTNQSYNAIFDLNIHTIGTMYFGQEQVMS